LAGAIVSTVLDATVTHVVVHDDEKDRVPFIYQQIGVVQPIGVHVHVVKHLWLTQALAEQRVPGERTFMLASGTLT
jgi:hypothetical protein